jgi:hypothetical protein
LKCEKCEYKAEDRGIMRKHLETHTGRNILPCGICEFESRKKSTLDKHINLKHGKKSVTDNNSYTCRKCERDFIGIFSFNHHNCCPQSYKYPCEYEHCEFIGTVIPDIVSHASKHHRQTVHLCPQCDFETDEKIIFSEHLNTQHKEISLLSTVSSQQTLLCESFEVFKKDISDIMNTLVQENNYLKSEILLLKEGKAQSKNTGDDEAREVSGKSKKKQT